MAPSRMVDVSASVNVSLHHKVQKFSSGTGSPWWSRKKGHKTVVVLLVFVGLKAATLRMGSCRVWQPGRELAVSIEKAHDERNQLCWHLLGISLDCFESADKNGA